MRDGNIYVGVGDMHGYGRVVGMKMSMEDRRMKGKFNGYFGDSGYQQWMKAKVTTVGPDDTNVPFFKPSNTIDVMVSATHISTKPKMNERINKHRMLTTALWGPARHWDPN